MSATTMEIAGAVPSPDFVTRSGRATATVSNQRATGEAAPSQRAPALADVAEPPEEVRVDFLEGSRTMSAAELASREITRYQVTDFYLEQIRRSGYYDRLKFIVEPSTRELVSPGDLDTSGEAENSVFPGFQHKYRQTGVLLVTDRCMAYCRYCFRKRLVGKQSEEVAPDYARVAAYISEHPEINNVLITGGDPFVLRTEQLREIVEELLPIPHLRTIRFGTKTLAFFPPRFADHSLARLFERIDAAGKTPVIVAHFDHVGEISADAEQHISRLRRLGVQFLNQAVLLAGVNDDPGSISAMVARVHEMGVRPYYLFQGRPVKAASHFQVPIVRGVEIVQGAAARLSGVQKTFRYTMSHRTGKIEILGISAGRLFMRYIHTYKGHIAGQLFSRRMVEGACWLDDLPEDGD